MPEIGVRDLKVRASEIVRNIRKRRTRYVITYRGRAVGLLLPLDVSPEERQPAEAASNDEVWQELMRLGAAIAKGWKSPLTSAELLSQMRR